MKLTDTELEKELAKLVPFSMGADLTAKLENSMNDCHDSSELRAIEAELAKLEPKELTEDQFELLEGAMELAHVEAELSAMTPVEMPTSLMVSLETAMNEADSKEDVKLVEFEPAAKASTFPMWVSAAAVIVLAAVSFIVFSPGQGSHNIAEVKPQPRVEGAVGSDKPFVVAPGGEIPYGTLSKNIVNASNQGVVMEDNKPHKRVRVDYEEIIQVTGADGRQYEKRVPKYKVFLVPVETN